MVEKPDPLEQLHKDQLRARVRELLEALPPLSQSIIHMHLWDDLTFKEIGEIKGLGLSQVKNQYYYGLRLLAAVEGQEMISTAELGSFARSKGES